MKIINLTSLTLLSVALLFSSCSPVLYSTVGQNVPMLTGKGEGTINIGYALSGSNDESTDAKGVSIQAAVSISNSWAIMSSYYALKGSDQQGYPFTAPSEFKSQGNYLEAGIGKFGKISSDNKFAFEVFAGMGIGSITNDYMGSTSNYQGASIDVKLLKPFLQPSIGYISKYVDFILTPRMGLINYNSSSGQVILSTFMDENNNKVVFEPGVTLRGGYKNVKLQLQYNYSTFEAKSVYLVDNEPTTFNPINQEYFSIGVYVLISNRYKQ